MAAHRNPPRRGTAGPAAWRVLWCVRVGAVAALAAGEFPAAAGSAAARGWRHGAREAGPTAAARGPREGSAASAWRPLPPPPAWFVSAAGAAVDEGRAVFVGGYGTGQKSGEMYNDVHEFDARTNAWRALPALNVVRGAAGAALVRGDLYAFGGRGRGGSLASVERLAGADDVKSTAGTWQQAPALPFGPRESPGCTALPYNRAAVIAGGFASWYVSGVLHFEYYNSTSLFDGTAYHQLPDMPFRRSNLALVAANGGVYAFGGSELEPSYESCAFLNIPAVVANADNVAEALRRAPALTWARCGPLVFPRSFIAAAAVAEEDGADTIIAAGGMDGNFNPADTTQVLVDGRSWQAASAQLTLPEPRGFSSAVVLDHGKRVVVAGGVGAGIGGPSAIVLESQHAS